MDVTLIPPTLDRAEAAAKETNSGELLECVYRNGTDRMVILRCCGQDHFYLERVIFPFEILSLQCPAHSELEVWTHGLGGPELIETLRAEELLIEAGAATAPSRDGELAGDTTYLHNPWAQAG